MVQFRDYFVKCLTAILAFGGVINSTMYFVPLSPPPPHLEENRSLRITDLSLKKSLK